MQYDFRSVVFQSSRISFSKIHLSSGSVTPGILVRKSLFLDCAETSDASIMIGSTHNSAVMMSFASFGIDATFSRMNRFGFVSRRILTYSRNNQERSPSSHFLSFFAIDKSWHGDHQIISSIFEIQIQSSVLGSEFICQNHRGVFNIQQSQETSFTFPMW